MEGGGKGVKGVGTWDRANITVRHSTHKYTIISTVHIIHILCKVHTMKHTIKPFKQFEQKPTASAKRDRKSGKCCAGERGAGVWTDQSLQVHTVLVCKTEVY